MKKLLLIILTLPLIISCKSKEEKALALINESMFKNLFDYDSYQPIETSIDSAFTSIYRDSVAILYAAVADRLFNEWDNNFEKSREYSRRADTYKKSYNNQDSYLFATNKAEELMGLSQHCLESSSLYIDSVIMRMNQLNPEFIGWSAEHKFRAKNKEGTPMILTFFYILDKNFTRILEEERMDDNSKSRGREIIRNILNEDFPFNTKLEK